MAAMLRVGERVLLLALSEERDKHPLGYLSSRLLADAEGNTRKASKSSRRTAPTYVSTAAQSAIIAQRHDDIAGYRSTGHHVEYTPWKFTTAVAAAAATVVPYCCMQRSQVLVCWSRMKYIQTITSYFEVFVYRNGSSGACEFCSAVAGPFPSSVSEGTIAPPRNQELVFGGAITVIRV